MAVLLVAHDVNPAAVLSGPGDLPGGRPCAAGCRRGCHHRPEAERAVRRGDRGAAHPRRAAGGRGPARGAPRPRAQARPDEQPHPHLESRQRRARAARLPVHGQRATGRDDRGRDGRRGRLVHGVAPPELRRAHDGDDVVPGGLGSGSGGSAHRAWLLPCVRGGGACDRALWRRGTARAQRRVGGGRGRAGRGIGARFPFPEPLQRRAGAARNAAVRHVPWDRPRPGADAGARGGRGAGGTRGHRAAAVALLAGPRSGASARRCR